MGVRGFSSSQLSYLLNEYAESVKNEPARKAVELQKQKKDDVMRLVEAQIAGCVDLSPEEMVDAAFIMVEKINDRLGI